MKDNGVIQKHTKEILENKSNNFIKQKKSKDVQKRKLFYGKGKNEQLVGGKDLLQRWAEHFHNI